MVKKTHKYMHFLLHMFVTYPFQHTYNADMALVIHSFCLDQMIYIYISWDEYKNCHNTACTYLHTQYNLFV
jgi:hypothetical protein